MVTCVLAARARETHTLTIRIETLRGDAVSAVLDEVARLRIQVFAEWPYLYDGDLSYERRYLEPYRSSSSAVVVAAFDGARLVGASTATAMNEHADEFSSALDGTDYLLSNIYYLAESVLLPEYRGRGIGHRFFDERERHARSSGYTLAAFCAVVRDSAHPLRPESPRDLAPFWRARGYRPVPGAVAHFSWKDLDQATETQKPLQLWLRQL